MQTENSTVVLQQKTCHRCQIDLAPTDTCVGPLKKSVYFHHACFCCQSCSVELQLGTYFNNLDDDTDLDVYCRHHCRLGSSEAIGLPDSMMSAESRSVSDASGSSNQGDREIKSFSPSKKLRRRKRSTPNVDASSEREVSDDGKKNGSDRDINVPTLTSGRRNCFARSTTLFAIIFMVLISIVFWTAKQIEISEKKMKILQGELNQSKAQVEILDEQLKMSKAVAIRQPGAETSGDATSESRDPDNQSNSDLREYVANVKGYIIAAGGWNGNHRLDNVYILDLANTSGQWTALPDLPSPSDSLALVRNLGQVYAIGGRMDQGKVEWDNWMNYLSIFDKKWVGISHDALKKGLTSAVSLHRSIYVVGSEENHESFQFLGWDFVCRSLPPSTLPHHESSAAVLNNKIFACAGWDTSDLCEFYDPSNQTWTTLPPMSIKRQKPAVVSLQNSLFVIGGADGPNERFDDASGQWNQFRETPSNRQYAAVVSDGTFIYMIGGETEYGHINDVLKYWPDKDIWEIWSPYPHSAYHIGAVYVKEMPDIDKMYFD